MKKKRGAVPKWVRVLVPSVLIVVWFIAGGLGGPYFGKISEVASNDQSTFLPESAESTQVSKELKKFQDQQSIPAIVVFDNNGKTLTDEVIEGINEQSKALNNIEGLAGEVSPVLVSDDEKAAFIVAPMDSTASYKQFSESLKESFAESDITATAYVTGPVGFLNDLGKAFEGIDGLLILVALSVVFVILIVVYRSPILPFLVLITSVFALCAAILAVYYLAKADIITLNGQVQGILFILVIGAATDYALLFVARYREELKEHAQPYDALITTWRRSIEPIAAAGGTVIAGLLCLLLSDLSSNKALGPVGAIGIIFAIISALTLLPSLLLPWGRKVFWPRIPAYAKKTTKKAKKVGVWPTVGNFVSRYPRRIWIITSVVLLVSSLGLLQLRADGIPQSEFVLGSSEARDGQRILDKHFPGGSGTPAYVIVPEVDLEKIVAIIEKDAGVASVAASAKDSPSGMIPLGSAKDELLNKIGESIPIGTPNRTKLIESIYPFNDALPTVVDNEVLLEVTLQDPADSEAAQSTIERLRSLAHHTNSASRVGGAAAVQLDTRLSSEHDRAVVIPAVLIVITIILMVLLRSLLAPLILLITTVISFAAALGVSALIFNEIFGFPGADPSVVLYAFIFLVALGIDYNIFLMTRVREESLEKGTRKGTISGLVTTGGVITSAGIVLAATFAALSVIPILFLVQLAFIVAFGVLLDTIVVRSLLVPALSYDLKSKIWWPSKKHKN